MKFDVEKIFEMQEEQKAVRKILDRKRLEWMALISILIHVLLIYVVLPEFHKVERVETQKKRYVTVRRWKTPPPQTQQKKVAKKQVQKKKRRFKPIPDPTPDDPEIEQDFEIEPEIQYDIPEDAEIIFGDPEGPPAPEIGDGPIRITGEVVRPVLIKKVNPIYPEMARKANIEGIVIVEAIIDKGGKVIDARILKSMGKSGLDEAAIDAVLKWEFTPATLNGVPVSVYMSLTVVFKLT